MLERSREHHRQTRERTRRVGRAHLRRDDLDVRFSETIEPALLVGVVQVVVDALRDDGADAVDGLQVLGGRLT